MSRAQMVLYGRPDRERACRLIEQAPTGTRVEFKGARRSLDQNSMMWVTLTAIASQCEHAGKKHTPDTWKVLLMHGWRGEVDCLPSLDGQSLVTIGRSSDLSKAEMTDFIEHILWWCAENGVKLHDDGTSPDDLAAQARDAA